MTPFGFRFNNAETKYHSVVRILPSSDSFFNGHAGYNSGISSIHILLDFTSMQRGAFLKPVLVSFGIVAVSLLMVVVLFYFRSIPMTFEHSGYPREMPAVGHAYTQIVAFLYGPMSKLIATAYDRLPVMGWLVSFASITTAVTVQNLLLWFGGKFLLERLRGAKT